MSRKYINTGDFSLGIVPSPPVLSVAFLALFVLVIGITIMIKAQENKNTAKITLGETFNVCWDTIFRSATNTRQPRNFLYIPPTEMLPVLCHSFFLAGRKSYVENYEPGSLRSLLSSFDRYRKRHGYIYSLSKDLNFSTLGETIKSKVKSLKKKVEITYHNVQNQHLSRRLNNCSFTTLWNFGLHGSTGYRYVSWGDVKRCIDSSGWQYREFNERQTKTGYPKSITSPTRCLAQVYKLYNVLRAADYCGDVRPLYLTMRTHQKIPSARSLWRS